MFDTVESTLDWLYGQKKKTKRENLDRIRRCAKDLNVDRVSYPIIHIAGTNGKGSTAAYIKHILAETGKKIGMFVSPYIVCFNERIQINDRYISDIDIIHYGNILYAYAEKYNRMFDDVIPFFELMVLMALLYFKDHSIDLAVIECGLGGRLDATNFLKTDLAIITNIGYDHMATLGNTLEEIAYQKLGIVKEGMTCLTTVDPSLVDFFKKHTEHLRWIYNDIDQIECNDKTRFCYKGDFFETPLLGEYQAYNAALAIEAVRYMEPTIDKETIQNGLNHTVWQGRMEILSKKPYIILDGAHNISAMEQVISFLDKKRRNRPIKVMFTALQDKAFDQMIHKLDKISSYYYFTSLSDSRAMDPSVFRLYTNKEYKVIENPLDCLNTAIQMLKEEEILFITGSLHFISVIREIYMKKFKKNLVTVK